MTRLDIYLLDFIQNILRTPFNDVIFTIITLMGELGFIWLLISVIFIIGKKRRTNGFLILTALAACILIGNLIIKNIVARPRPFTLNEEIDLFIPPPRGYSFPSAHTMTSFAAATVICYTDKKIGIFSLCLASLIAFSRIYLYVHYPSDVIAGLLSGIAVGMAVCEIYRSIASRRKNKNKNKDCQ